MGRDRARSHEIVRYRHIVLGRSLGCGVVVFIFTLKFTPLCSEHTPVTRTYVSFHTFKVRSCAAMHRSHTARPTVLRDGRRERQTPTDIWGGCVKPDYDCNMQALV